MSAASRLAGLDTGQSVVHVSRRGVFQVQFPMAKPVFARTPKYGAKKEAEHFRMLTQRPEYASPQTILAQRKEATRIPA